MWVGDELWGGEIEPLDIRPAINVNGLEDRGGSTSLKKWYELKVLLLRILCVRQTCYYYTKLTLK